MTTRHEIDDAITRAMADRLFDAGAMLLDVEDVIRVLMEARFLAREIAPRIDFARHQARCRYGRIYLAQAAA